jgi:hypothetical protein
MPKSPSTTTSKPTSRTHTKRCPNLHSWGTGNGVQPTHQDSNAKEEITVSVNLLISRKPSLARWLFWYNIRQVMANRSILVFVVFMIHALSEAWHMSPQKVYSILNKSKVLDNYLIRHYDVLHTLGKEYLVEDVTGCVKDWGYEIA